MPSKKHRPKKFQLKAIRKINHFNGRVLLADEMGLGKTLEALLWMKQAGSSVYPAIVVCPASLKWVWEKEAIEQINVRAIVLDGQKPSKKSVLEIPKLIIINYEILQYWEAWLKKIKAQTIAFDESHYLKSSGAIRTRTSKSLAKKIPNVIGISGTPLTNRPDELWNIISIVRPDIFSSRYAYRWRYCKPVLKPWGWDYKGATNLKELHRKLSSTMMIRRLKKDVLSELPAKTRHVIPLDISPKARIEYNQAQNNFLQWLSKTQALNKVRAAEKAEALVKLGYLRRLAANSKMKGVFDWIDNFLEEDDGKLIVFANHKNIIQQVKERYNKVCVVVDGSVTGKKRKNAVKGFQNNKRIRLFIGNIKAAGVGITLHASSTVAFIELDYVPANHTQAEDRPHRIGQKNAVNIYYLVARNTIEEDLCEIIQAKQEILSQVLDGKRQKDDLDVWSQLQERLLKG